jgi:orotate phosphoribosyltransferase
MNSRVEAAGLSEGELRDLLALSGALRQGHFLLSSGLHSPAYVQCALLLEDPHRARRVGEALARLLAPLAPSAVVAPALGGLIIGHEVAAALGVPFRFTERQDGVMALRRGFSFEPGEPVVVVEDVITTGKSTRETVGVIEKAGAKVVGIGAILDRSGDAGGSSSPLPFAALLRLDLPVYESERCPLCRAGGHPEKPGSRM